MKKILAIDDNPDNLTTLKAAISSNNKDYIVLTELSGDEGIKTARTEQPDVILLDLVMPGKDGFQVCKILKEDDSTKFIPIIIFSANIDNPEKKVLGFNSGANAFISKPFVTEELCAHIRAMIRVKEAEDILRQDKINLDRLVKEKTNEIAESERKYRTFFENNEAIILFIDPENGNIIFANDAASSYYGYGKDEFNGMNISKINILEPEEIRSRMELAGKAKQNYFIFKHKRADNSIRDVEVYQTKLSLDGKEVFSIIVHDITDRKKAEDLLSERETVLNAIFESTGDGLLVVDNEGKVTHKNAEFLKMWSISEELKETRDDTKLLEYVINQLSDPDKFIEKVQKLYNSIDIDRDQLNFKDGKIFDRRSTPLIINDTIIGRVWRFTDVTERKKAELQLKQSEERFKQLFQNLGDAVYVTRIGGDEKGRILEINPAAVYQTGYSREELLNMNIINDLNVDGSGEINTDEWEEKILNGELVVTTEKKRKKDGSEIWTEVIVTSIDFGDEKAGLSINHNITEQKLAQEEIKKYQEHLEEIVKERTSQLEDKNNDLERMNRLFVGREFRIKELRDKVKDLERRLIDKNNYSTF